MERDTTEYSMRVEVGTGRYNAPVKSDCTLVNVPLTVSAKGAAKRTGVSSDSNRMFCRRARP